MGMTNKPMAPSRMKWLREAIPRLADPNDDDAHDAVTESIGALLGAHDHYRSRVQVTAEDIEHAGVTRAHVIAWLTEHGWAESPREGPQHPHHGTTWRTQGDPGRGIPVYDEDLPGLLRESTRSAAHHHGLGHWELLDQLALVELPS